MRFWSQSSHQYSYLTIDLPILMAVEHLDLYFLKSSCYSANATPLSLHLIIATLAASFDVIFFGFDSLSWVDDSLLEASLTFDQPYFPRCFGDIWAIKCLDKCVRFNASASATLERMDITYHLCNPRNRDLLILRCRYNLGLQVTVRPLADILSISLTKHPFSRLINFHPFGRALRISVSAGAYPTAIILTLFASGLEKHCAVIADWNLIGYLSTQRFN